MRKLLLFLRGAGLTVVSLLCMQAGLLAQRTVSGAVSDADGTLPGVNVVVKGSATGVLSGADGKYSISVPNGEAVLVFSSLGYSTKEVAVGNRTVIDVRLDTELEALDELIVVAYGTAKKSSFTGAASTVKGESLIKGQTSNVTKAIEGSVAGVRTSSSSGQPGASASIRIRGFGSISANSNALIVVDGVPYEGSLNSISPQDIESLTVLKDAASNSMYGARGSNGVIMITTKKGASGKTKINFDARIGANSRAVPIYSVISDPADYYEIIWEANRNQLVESGVAPLSAGEQASSRLISSYLGYNIYQGVDDAALVDPITGRINPAAKTRKWNDNWAKDPFRNGLRQEYNVNISGGTDNTNAYMSVGYLNDEGYVKSSDFERISARVKVDQKLGKYIKTGANIAYAKTSTDQVTGSTGGTNYSNIFMFTQQIAPIYPIYKYDLATGAKIYRADGAHAYDFGSQNVYNGESSTLTRAYAGEQNPMFVLENDIDKYQYDNLTSRVYTEIKFLNDFTFTANLSYDIFNYIGQSFNNPTIGNGKSYGGIGDKLTDRYEAINANQLLNWHRQFNDHTFDVLVGHETKSDQEKYFYGAKMQFYDPYNAELSNAGSMSSLTSWTESYRLEGYLSKLEYNYADRYYLSASFRRDASSRFAPAVRWGNFWSAGGSWRIKEESFLKNVKAVDNLKIKASYGTQGNDGISRGNLYTDQYSIVSDGVYPSPVLSFRGNPDLTWEKSQAFNVGLEVKLFDRVEIIADYYIKNTKDLLYQKPLSPSLGNPTWIWDNQIDMQNKGIELEINLNLINTNDVKWDLSFNITSEKNKLTKLPDDKKDPKGYVNGNYWWKIGGSIRDWYTYEYAGVDAATGKALYYLDLPVDANNDGEQDKDADGNLLWDVKADKTTTQSSATRYETGKSAVPTAYGGVSTSLKLYGFDLSIGTAYQIGGYFMDSKYQSLMSGGENGSNWSTDIFRRWTPNNTQTDVPRVAIGDQNANAASDRWLTDASYFSLRNITLGYTLPKRIVNKLSVETVRVYLAGDNLLFFSRRKGFDPRESFDGVVYTGVYSPLRTISGGIAIAF